MDSLALLAASPAMVGCAFTDQGAGRVEVDGYAVTSTGLESVADQLVPDSRTFTFGDGADAIVLALDRRTPLFRALGKRSLSRTHNVARDLYGRRKRFNSGEQFLANGIGFCGAVGHRCWRRLCRAFSAYADLKIASGTGDDLVSGVRATT